jgi:hypothetical protein
VIGGATALALTAATCAYAGQGFDFNPPPPKQPAPKANPTQWVGPTVTILKILEGLLDSLPSPDMGLAGPVANTAQSLTQTMTNTVKNTPPGAPQQRAGNPVAGFPGGDAPY